MLTEAVPRARPRKQLVGTFWSALALVWCEAVCCYQCELRCRSSGASCTDRAVFQRVQVVAPTNVVNLRPHNAISIARMIGRQAFRVIQVVRSCAQQVFRVLFKLSKFLHISRQESLLRWPYPRHAFTRVACPSLVVGALHSHERFIASCVLSQISVTPITRLRSRRRLTYIYNKQRTCSSQLP
eukprot:1195077-Prorocentrum_minimum.AAC.11